MNDFFKLNEYIIKQKVQPFKSTKTIVIINPETKEEIGSIMKIILKQEGWFKRGRDAIGIYNSEGNVVSTIGEIEVMGGTDERNEESSRMILGILDENNNVVGKFYSKNFLGATWFIEDPENSPVGELKVGFTGDKVVDTNGEDVLKIGTDAAGAIREAFTKAKSYKLKMLKDVDDNEKVLFVTAAMLYQVMCSFRVSVW